MATTEAHSEPPAKESLAGREKGRDVVEEGGADPNLAHVRSLIAALQRGKGSPESKDWGGAMFLIGAGCSVSAGIPAAAGIAADCVIDLACKYSNGDFKPSSPEDALAWLQREKHLDESLTLKTAYPMLFRDHYPDPVEQQEVIQKAINKAKSRINWAHLCLGQLVSSGYINTVLTTNFDQLVLEGIIRTGIIPVVADGVDVRMSLNPRNWREFHKISLWPVDSRRLSRL
jgi:hypothetical protein